MRHYPISLFSELYSEVYKMNNNQKKMKSSHIDSGAFNVLFDSGSINLQICYKGVPIQVITFSTSDDYPIMDKDVETVYTIDALRLGYQILFGLIVHEERMPKHMLDKAQEVEDSGVFFEEREWMNQRLVSRRLLCTGRPAPDHIPLEELLKNEKANYRHYEA